MSKFGEIGLHDRHNIVGVSECKLVDQPHQAAGEFVVLVEEHDQGVTAHLRVHVRHPPSPHLQDRATALDAHGSHRTHSRIASDYLPMPLPMASPLETVFEMGSVLRRGCV
jgi:hypothetical protein